VISKLNPAVPRRFLFAIAGLLWTVAGILVCIRGIIWLEELRFEAALPIGIAAVIVAIVVYSVLFSRVVQNNISRIVELPERVCIFAFTPWRGYIMIALMITAGITLRNSPIPHSYLCLPYTSMGGMLLAGSVRFYREFLHAIISVKS